MNIPFGFDIGEGHYARQLDLESDGATLGALGRRCVEYLRCTTDGTFDTDAAPRVFLQMLQPLRASSGGGFVLGIFRRSSLEGSVPPRPVGVLYFLHPDQGPGTWYILLLLLEPAARGKGLGSAVHAAFVRWAAARGARRLVVAASEANGQALRFWRDRLGYTETASGRQQTGGEVYRRSLELEHRLALAPNAVPWMRRRA